jgi:hypothetical protein
VKLGEVLTLPDGTWRVREFCEEPNTGLVILDPVKPDRGRGLLVPVVWVAALTGAQVEERPYLAGRGAMPVLPPGWMWREGLASNGTDVVCEGDASSDAEEAAAEAWLIWEGQSGVTKEKWDRLNDRSDALRELVPPTVTLNGVVQDVPATIQLSIDQQRSLQALYPESPKVGT